MSNLPDWKTIPRAELGKLVAEDWGAGLSARQIADKFQNCSRSAVIGLVHRLKLKLNSGAPREGKPGRRPKTAGEPRPKPNRKPRVTKLVKETTSWRGPNNPNYSDIKSRAERRAASPGLPAHLVAGEAPKPIDTEIPVSRDLALADLTNHTCRWPHGDPLTDGFGFCGNGTIGTGSYCKYHSRIAFLPTSERQRTSLRAAERLK